MINYHNQFNHQSHHRGQATTLFFQAGVNHAANAVPVMLMEKN